MDRDQRCASRSKPRLVDLVYEATPSLPKHLKNLSGPNESKPPHCIKASRMGCVHDLISL